MEILQDNYEDNCHLLQVTWQETLWDQFIPCILLTALLVMTIWALCFFRKFFSDCSQGTALNLYTLYKALNLSTLFQTFFRSDFCRGLFFGVVVFGFVFLPPYVLLVEAYNSKLALKFFSAPTEETLVWLLF